MSRALKVGLKTKNPESKIIDKANLQATMRLRIFYKTQEVEEYLDNEWKIALDLTCGRQ